MQRFEKNDVYAYAHGATELIFIIPTDVPLARKMVFQRSGIIDVDLLIPDSFVAARYAKAHYATPRIFASVEPIRARDSRLAAWFHARVPGARLPSSGVRPNCEITSPSPSPSRARLSRP